MSRRFAFVANPIAKWVVAIAWLAVVVLSTAAGIPTKFENAQDNESTSFLPGDAESTKVLTAATQLQGGELAPAVIVYRRASGLTAADKQQIVKDVEAMTARRFPGVVPDGATAAAGGHDAAAAPPETEGCGTPLTTIPGQPAGYAPFVGPVCSPDGKAALVLAYIRGNGETGTILDPVKFWRDSVSNPGGGLDVKVTGAAGYSADAITIFTNINGTLLLAATLLVVVLLILIYRSPVFLFIPLAGVLFAEVLTRTLGYVLSELGVTINAQSAAIMSVLVLGAGTDYALLIVARYREEMHRQADKYAAMRSALTSAGPAIFASAATVIAALFCLSIAKVNGTSGLGPLGALGVFCAALSMLTLLPALLLIFGRRAFWPFVPHTPDTRPKAEAMGGSGIAALAKAMGGCLIAAVLLPLTVLSALVRRLFGTPSVVSLLDGPIFTPYELRRVKHEHVVDETHGIWKRVGDRVAVNPRRTLLSALALLGVMCLGLVFFSTDLTTNDSYRHKVEAIEGQALLAESFPAGSSAPTDIVVTRAADVERVSAAVAAVPGVQTVSPPVASDDSGRTLIQATLEPPPYSTQAFALIEPIRAAVAGKALVGGATAVEYDVRQAASWDSTVIPPIVLAVVFVILMLLLRAVIGPLLLIGTVILSYLAALGVSYFMFDVVFGFAGSDPSLPLFGFVFLVALGVDYNIFLAARAREETFTHGTRAGMLRALAVTGGVITSAGIVLAGTFAVLGSLPLVFLTEIGFLVAFGVLLDTFLVRSVVVPAATLLVGPRFWWPSSLARTDGAAEREEPVQVRA